MWAAPFDPGFGRSAPSVPAAFGAVAVGKAIGRYLVLSEKVPFIQFNPVVSPITPACAFTRHRESVTLLETHLGYQAHHPPVG